MSFKDIKEQLKGYLRRFEIIFNSLEEREYVILVIGLYSVILIVGIFFITERNIKNLISIDKKLDREISNYIQLKEIASEYIALKGHIIQSKSLTLKDIENYTKQAGIKDKIASLRPLKKEIELTLNNLRGDEVIKFLRLLSSKHLKISRVSIEKRNNGSLRLKITIVNR